MRLLIVTCTVDLLRTKEKNVGLNADPEGAPLMKVALFICPCNNYVLGGKTVKPYDVQ